MPVIQSVRNTEELRRVRALPRRGAYSNGTLEGVDLVGQLTELLRTPNGTQTLRPVQPFASSSGFRRCS